MTAYLYHWTTRRNLSRISLEGLDPHKAMGFTRRVWMVVESRIRWAKHHIAKEKGLRPEDMALLRIRIKGLPLRRTTYVGVFASVITIGQSRIEYRLSAKAAWRKVERFGMAPGLTLTDIMRGG